MKTTLALVVCALALAACEREPKSPYSDPGSPSKYWRQTWSLDLPIVAPAPAVLRGRDISPRAAATGKEAPGDNDDGAAATLPKRQLHGEVPRRTSNHPERLV